MKEVIHRELARLVAGAARAPRAITDRLVEGAVEPDQVNKEAMREDITAVLPVSIEWLVDHTVRARTLAMQGVFAARDLYRQRDPRWARVLGWAWHYIADWGTPHHSPTSKVNPVPALGIFGALVGAFIGGLKGANESPGKALNGALKGALIGGGISAGAGAIGLAITHSSFEKRMDEVWTRNHRVLGPEVEKLIHITRKDLKKVPADRQLDRLSTLLGELRARANDIPDGWLSPPNGPALIEYLGAIARAMYVAYAVVTG